VRKLPIAYGNSCFAKTWPNKTITFDELCARLEHTIRTTETAEEYPKLPKAERDRIKDKGGFVGGQLRDNRRKRETVVVRSLLTLDCDHAETDFISRFTASCEYAACLYTTHGHTPEAPRVRIVLPTTRDITHDEYAAIARYFADEWGIDQFDECSYLPHQLMYWPTTPSNGEYVFKRIDGPWLDPDAYLAAHPNWKECTLLPTSSRESAIRKQGASKQEDPLTKSGIVGAFCRAYTIEDAIDSFLHDVYTPSAIEGRYDYAPAESTAGLVLYDGKYAYSHHASDPACEKLLNAFDLVKAHKFGNLEDKPAYKAMSEFALEQDKVKLQMDTDRMEQAKQDFAGKDWQKRLKYMPRSSELDNSVWNEMVILNNDPDFRNFAYNELANRIQITGDVPWERPKDNKYWRDADTAQLKALLDIRYQCFSSRNHDVSFTKIADDRRFHPIRDYLDGLPHWDTQTRTELLLIRYLKANDTPYVRAVTRKAIVAAVARTYRPGIKFDSMLVTDGPQGIGKSTLFKILAGEEFYSDTLSLTDMDDKSGAEKLQGFWIVEIGELAGMKKADIEKVKAFLSTADDKYRPSYGKTVESHPRQCIIIGTVNGERGYLRDITGNRRFWIVKVHQEEQAVNWTITPEERDQIWAEAKYLYEHGEKLYLEGDLLKAAEEAQREAMEVDERQGMVEAYLERLLPEGWEEMDLYRRREFIRDLGDPTQPRGTVRRDYVSNQEIWCECFGRKPDELKPADSYGLAALMTKVPGWERTKQIKDLPQYGRQRLYKRTCVSPKTLTP